MIYAIDLNVIAGLHSRKRRASAAATVRGRSTLFICAKTFLGAEEDLRNNGEERFHTNKYFMAVGVISQFSVHKYLGLMGT